MLTPSSLVVSFLTEYGPGVLGLYWIGKRKTMRWHMLRGNAHQRRKQRRAAMREFIRST